MSVYFVGMVALCFAAGPIWHICLGLVFAAAHELGHLAAMAIFRIRPCRICLTAAGMRIERPPGLRTGFSQEICIAFAGPLTSLCLAAVFFLLWRVFAFSFYMDACLLNLGFGLFNLLPVRQLDGGRALYFTLCRHMQEITASRAVQVISFVCLFLAATAAMLLCLRRGFSLSLVVVVVYLAVCC